MDEKKNDRFLGIIKHCRKNIIFLCCFIEAGWNDSHVQRAKGSGREAIAQKEPEIAR